MIGVIGVGNMAGAIIKGAISGGVLPEQLGLFDTDEAKLARFPQAMRYPSARALVEAEEIVFFAVKPQVLPEVLSELSGVRVEGKVFVSICAGISTDNILEALPGAHVVRAMPNTPMLYGKGVCALCRSALVSDAEFERVNALFALLGKVISLPETQMNAVIALTSSSPAYLFKLSDAMARAAVEEGFSYEESVELTADVFCGAAEMLRHSGMTPAELCDMVSSPGGTTLAALRVFEKEGFTEMVRDAMNACTKRAKELSR